MPMDICAREQFFRNLVWAEFLAQATPDDIHKSLLSSNWDNNEFLLDWILEHPQVDRATVLLAFWMGGALEMEAYERQYLSGFYATSEIAMDPACDQDGYDWTTGDQRYLHPDFKLLVSSEMLKPLTGRVIRRPSDYEEGLPFEYYEKFCELMNG
ncbi:DUF4274 domain-containing protein [Shewanella sedimentimangrovi]|uniref:DUF4274 domain-containing protein n=1 Tax=Shewanella sedimentimangrovi TaxID=2814293 RepID=A0ABX7R436_9GAMM|nr:DUF4274 domain-containing protein [Shewanella sedimentimangrovi]QSX37551.1 DUF4274 domain-containing protein [Shewanella sedimentimangrovi]